MKPIEDYTPEQLQALLADEQWDAPLPPVQRQQLKPWQQWVFWGLCIYVVVMCVIVLWAFTGGLHV